MKAFAITMAAISIIGFFFIGRLSKQCDDCVIPEPVIKYIKIEHHEKEIEIKREFEKKIHSIDTISEPALDSIWTEYAIRYGKI